MSGGVDVGACADFPIDEIRVVAIGSRSIAVVRRDDERVYAFRTRCPHQQGPLEHGKVFPRVVSDVVGEIGLDDPPVVACPWHGWEFDVSTGVALCRPSLRIAVYAARVLDGRVLVDPVPVRRPVQAAAGAGAPGA